MMSRMAWSEVAAQSGSDLHRRYLVAEVVDYAGRRVEGTRLPNNGGRLLAFLADLKQANRVVFE